MPMDFVEIALVVANLLAGFSFAFPISKVFAKVAGKPAKVIRYYIMLLGIYLLESVVLMVGMGIPVLNVVLAFVWGVVFGTWLRKRTSRSKALRTSFWFSLYSSLPAISFILVPVFAGLGGWNILSSSAGDSFGIPQFLYLPWPLNTILGFYMVIIIVAVILKVVITVGEVNLLILPKEKSVSL
jgi:hypothetical protein